MTTTENMAPRPFTKEDAPLRQWVSSGLHCALMRAPLWGAINGYVQVPSITYEQAQQIEVHGGVTYGPNDDNWIGFDTLHSGDYWPESGYRTSHDRTWSEDEVAAECERFAASAKAVMEL